VSKSVLVGYATIHGSTKEVAEAIAETLRESGLEVAFQPLREVRDLAGYSAVVVGAPLYMFKWHKDARRFLSRHREALGKMPVAVFALGPINNVEKEFTDARGMLGKALEKFPWLKPVEIALFGGKLDPAHFRFPYNLIPAMNKMPASDIRDWDAIHAWASGLVEKFR
jgi:menaquinone-dependent protoporphyrinogen oxidase